MKTGFLQALGVTAYCAIIGLIFWQGNNIFGKLPNFFGPVVFIMLFSTSALICGLLVFYKPYKLFLAGKKKEAVDVVVTTAISLFIVMVLFFTGLIIFK